MSLMKFMLVTLVITALIGAAGVLLAQWWLLIMALVFGLLTQFGSLIAASSGWPSMFFWKD